MNEGRGTENDERLKFNVERGRGLQTTVNGTINGESLTLRVERGRCCSDVLMS